MEIIIWVSEEYSDIVQEAIEYYKEENDTNVYFSVEVMPYDILKMKVAAGVLGEEMPDIVLLNDEDLKYYVKNFSSKFVALEEYMESGDWEKNFIPFKIDIALTDKPVTVIPNGGEILQELKRQGNNLNQAVRRC